MSTDDHNDHCREQRAGHEALLADPEFTTLQLQWPDGIIAATYTRGQVEEFAKDCTCWVGEAYGMMRRMLPEVTDE